MTTRQSSTRQVGGQTVSPAPSGRMPEAGLHGCMLCLVGRSTLSHLDSEGPIGLPPPVDWESICFIIALQRANIDA
ncbi:hypothetical protein GCM10009078_15190 [Cupriavidus gilardii]